MSEAVPPHPSQTAAAAQTPVPSGAGPQRPGRVGAAFARYRVMAFITGVMLLVLCVEMVLKYVFDLPWVDTWLGWVPFAHGWIYVAYLFTAFDVWSKARWRLRRLMAMIAGGVVPVLSFVVERRAAGWLTATVSPHGPAAGSTLAPEQDLPPTDPQVSGRD